jgi:branched-chain amino acid transport system substrate-binding protein
MSICALSVGGCGTNSSSTSGIKLGIIYSLSGDQASLDESSLKGAELAVDYINAHGGISGTPIALEIRDAATSSTETPKQAEELFESEKVSLIVGLSDTDLAAPVAKLSQELGRIFITSGATGPVLTTLGPQSTFLACFSDDSQAMAASRFARERLRARSALVAYDQGTEYARILSTSFSKSFTASGGKVSGHFRFTVENTNTAALTKELIRTNPDIVFLAAQPDEVADVIRSLRSTGFTKPIVGGDSYDSARIYDLSSTEKAKVYFTTHTLLTASSSNPRIEEFMKQYKSYYGEEPTSAFAALGYDAVRLASLAIGKAQSVEPGAIRSALESIREYPGVTGSISYGPAQHIPHKDVTIVTFDDGVPTRAQ